MPRTLPSFLVLLFPLMLSTACSEPEGEREPASTTQEEEEKDEIGNNNNTANSHDAGPVVRGSVAGKIVNASGNGLMGMRLLACTDSLCMSGETDANGEYLFENLAVEPLKMQLEDLEQGVLNDSFLSRRRGRSAKRFVSARGDAEGARECCCLVGGQRRDGIRCGWCVDADGRIRRFGIPFWLQRRRSFGEYVGGADIPPYNVEPFLADVENAFAFMLQPVGTKSSQAVSFTISDHVTQPELTVYDVYEVTGKAKLNAIGTATVNASGDLVSDAATNWTELTGLVLVPQSESAESVDAGSAADVSEAEMLRLPVPQPTAAQQKCWCTTAVSKTPYGPTSVTGPKPRFLELR